MKGQDADLLISALDAERFNPSTIYTWVACGHLPPGVDDVQPDDPDYGYISGYFKRIDLVALVSQHWYVIEIKPSAGYVALGQALTYAFLARRRYPLLRKSLCGVLTDCPDPDVIELFREHDVTVWAERSEPFIPMEIPG